MCSRSRRSSASTTSSARRRCRTSSRCASRTASSSRSGTATTSTTSRSTSPRRSRSSRAGFYEAPARSATWSSTHLFQVLGFVAMEPPTSLAAKALRDEKVEGLRVHEAARPARRARPVRGISPEDGVAPDSTPRRSSRSRSRSTTGAGLASRSILRTGKQLPRAAASSRSPSRSLRCGCSPAARLRPERARLRDRRARRDLGQLPRQGARRDDQLGPASRFHYEESFCDGSSSRPTSG